ncbi:hypothetical protein JAAARDRAFT_28517 [Jaapia argillacea MUCL 33604]|uniref:DUF7719 domain-containing protein n=1 Tax=Jaapia argillacea MUCL 33604 TaxID=933084 RepID=A0A067QCS1_9AGAM|nr:hypothetical protein JAAARDRAFT_28517 [Jaapia argillacea MUCL 33604]
MAKKSKTKKAQPPATAHIEEISDEEQWRLINESGVLQKLSSSNGASAADKETEPTADEMGLAEEIFNAIIFIMPFSFCLLMMDILIHLQYAKRPTVAELAERMLSGVPILAIFIFYSSRYKAYRQMQVLLFWISIAVGTRLIWLVNRGNWLVNIRQCPPLATAWIYTIVQLDLGYAVLALGAVGSWAWWAEMKLMF